MGVAVLQPRDCLKNLPSSKPMKLPNPSPQPTRRTRTHPNRPKRSLPTRPASTSDPNPQLSNKLVMGHVKILKRGEQLTQTTPDTVKEEFRSTEPLTEIVGGLYAGSSMVVASPPPSSVPLPAFVTKNIVAVKDATSDLRKMLRLDFS